jgi:hypothetical protein
MGTLHRKVGFRVSEWTSLRDCVCCGGAGNALATAGSICAIGCYLRKFFWWFVGLPEWVMLVICWPTWASFVVDLLAYRHVQFAGNRTPGNPAGWVEYQTILFSMAICNTVMTGSCTCVRSYCPSCTLLIKVPWHLEWNVIFNCLIRPLWSTRSQL